MNLTWTDLFDGLHTGGVSCQL